MFSPEQQAAILANYAMGKHEAPFPTWVFERSSAMPDRVLRSLLGHKRRRVPIRLPLAGSACEGLDLIQSQDRSPEVV